MSCSNPRNRQPDVVRRRQILGLGLLSAMPALADSGGRQLDLSNYEASFAADFTGPAKPLLRSDGGPFSSRYEDWGGLRTLPGNKEQELYVDAGFIPAAAGTDARGHADAPAGSPIRPLGINPFVFESDGLEITAIQTPPPLRRAVDRPYLSGMLATDRTFSQRYGYFEMLARLPAGRGLWPAFWLVSKTYQEHIEIDVMEAVGWDTAHVYQSTHLNPSRGKGIHVKVGPEEFDYATGFHSYGVAWTPDDLVFYIDGIETTRTGGRPFRDIPPMYMIANLAVGGEWAGTPDHDTRFPAAMQIKHIRAYRLRGPA
ncbi:MAG TPA: glycoside hydrolase family 16 protein [Rhodopila sp.]|nr:glycoside hydrolase family 16 protein [Rhodopila sp.]